MSIYSKNEEILKRWEVKSKKNKEIDEFVPDGIMYRGELHNCENGIGCEHLPSKDFKVETETWENAPMRFLYITKELNAYDGPAWEVRGEVGGRKKMDSYEVRGQFHRNIVYQLYGLGHTTPKRKVLWNDKEFTDENALKFYDSCAFARINVKKQAGKSRIEDNVLTDYMGKYSALLQEQILNLDADIIVCGGSNGGRNLILDFLKENCYRDLTAVMPDNNWIYYSEKYNKIAINSWHPSYFGISSQDFYDGMITAYFNFLKKNPQFLKSHR